MRFARQVRFLSVQVAFYLAVAVAAFALLLLFAAGLVHSFSSGGIAASIAAAEKMLWRLGLLALAAGVAAWLAAKWLSLYFIFSAKNFFEAGKAERVFAGGRVGKFFATDSASARLASTRFLEFVKASFLMGAVFLLGTVFFLLLGSAPGLESAASLVSSLYALFFTLCFLFAPFHLTLRGRGMWQALSDGFDSFSADPLRAFLLMLAAEIVEAVSLAVSLIPLALSSLALLWAFSSGAGSLALVAFVALFLLSLVILAVGISFANLAAIGLYCSAFLGARAAARKNKFFLQA